MQNRLIKKITIVGGGTAGWMAASLLSKLTLGAFDIELVESDEIGIIGVGEATIPAIKIFNKFLEIDEAEIMRATQGTFKLGIEFVNWRDLGHTYVHGFGKIGQDLLWMRTHQFYNKLAAKGKNDDFDSFSICTSACRQNKFQMPSGQTNTPLHDLDYAYQFDATLYGRYLRKLAETSGVKRTEGKIVDVIKDPLDGYIKKVKLESGQEIDGDFWIDCSGQRGILINGALGVGFESYSKWLLCNRAWAVQCESVEPLTPYTRSTARESGWQWRIPLQHRIGNGIVYSAEHLEDDKAAEILLNNLDGKPLTDPRLVKFNPGKRLRTFEKNCVAIGLSSGFLEPIESTAIHLIQSHLLRLLSLFPSKQFNPADIEEYNKQTQQEYEDIRDFIIAHYKITNREDTPFWKYCKNMEIPDRLQKRLELFKSSGRFFKFGEELFREESWVQVLLGQGFKMNPDPMADLIPDDDIMNFLDDIKDVIKDAVNDMPDHQKFIESYCKA